MRVRHTTLDHSSSNAYLSGIRIFRLSLAAISFKCFTSHSVHVMPYCAAGLFGPISVSSLTFHGYKELGEIDVMHYVQCSSNVVSQDSVFLYDSKGGKEIVIMKDLTGITIDAFHCLPARRVFMMVHR